MGTIKSENWDGVTAPALPTGWVAAAAIVTETARFNSSPNALHNPVNITSNVAYWDTDTDGNGGNAQASHVLVCTSFAVTAIGKILCRMTAPQTTQTGLTCYGAGLDFAGSVTLEKYVAGTRTVIGTLSAPDISTSDKYKVYCVAVSNMISARVQRLSDSKWLNSSAVWQVSQADAIATTDEAISGAGKAGIMLTRFGTSDLLASDDFLFETVGASSVAMMRHPRLIQLGTVKLSLS